MAAGGPRGSLAHRMLVGPRIEGVHTRAGARGCLYLVLDSHGFKVFRQEEPNLAGSSKVHRAYYVSQDGNIRRYHTERATPFPCNKRLAAGYKARMTVVFCRQAKGPPRP